MNAFLDAPRSPKSAPIAPNRGRQGVQERAEHPNQSDQGDLDETLRLRSKIDENIAPVQRNLCFGALGEPWGSLGDTLGTPWGGLGGSS